MLITKPCNPGYEEYTIDVSKWLGEKPFGISGCFRIRNDQEFMETSILSHLPYLDEAVLVVQESDDDTVAIAHRLADEYAKINVYTYPVIPFWIDTEEFKRTPVDSIYHPVFMSNWALSKCKYSWIAKTEADVFCLPTFENIVNFVYDDPDNFKYYGRVILNLAGENCEKVSATNPRNWGMDEAVFPNDPRFHFVLHGGKWESVNFFDYPGSNVCPGWSAFHLKRCKKRFLDWAEKEVWVDFTQENVEKLLQEYNSTHAYPGKDNPLGIPEFYKGYRISKNMI